MSDVDTPSTDVELRGVPDGTDDTLSSVTTLMESSWPPSLPPPLSCVRADGGGRASCACRGVASPESAGGGKP